MTHQKPHILIVDDTPGDLHFLLENLKNEFALQGVVQIHADNGRINAGSRGVVSPLESELLYRVRDQQRMVEFNNRIIFNVSPFSLLVSRLPEDEEKQGRIRDNMLLLLLTLF